MGTEVPFAHDDGETNVRKIFFAFCRTVNIFATEINNAPLEIIGNMKLLNDLGFKSYREFRLPSPIYPNIHRFGPYSIDTERWRYSDPILVTEGKYLNIPNGFKNKILEESEKVLGEDVVNLIAEKIKTKIISYGSNFSAWRWSLKQKWVEKWSKWEEGRKESFIVYEKKKSSLGDIQIEDFVVRRSMNTTNWVLNPKFIEELESWERSESFEFKLPPFGSYSTGEVIIPSKELEAKKLCNKLLCRMLKEKRRLFKNDQGWRFRINKVNVKKRINVYDLEGLTLYIGNFVLLQGEWFFVDTYYTRDESDYISVEPFEGINKIITPAVALLGRISSENKEVKIFPIGILKLL
jgi:hypothetical protein